MCGDLAYHNRIGSDYGPFFDSYRFYNRCIYSYETISFDHHFTAFHIEKSFMGPGNEMCEHDASLRNQSVGMNSNVLWIQVVECHASSDESSGRIDNINSTPFE